MLQPLWAANGKTIRQHCVFPTIVRLIRCSRVSCRTRGTASRRASFSGLTRFDRDSQYPCGDLAHHWKVSADGLRWDFYIRSTLHWHNGDAVDTAQLHERTERLLTLPALSKLFISVARIEVTHPQCLTFLLHRPDYWLAHRLASYCSGLAHPDLPLIGTGPFRRRCSRRNWCVWKVMTIITSAIRC